MPPTIATLLACAAIVWLLRWDARQQPRCSSALWLPALWLFVIGSRSISEWINLGQQWDASRLEDGSPLDGFVYLVLILAALFVLKSRNVRPWKVLSENRWLTVYLLYCLVSILWSDFPFVAFKRWFKVLGHPIMALVVLTELDRVLALTHLMKRCAFLLIPLSVLFVKYYPELGRGYDEWTGRAVYTGVTTNKNALGYLCMLFGFFFVWHSMRWRKEPRGKARRNELLISLAFLAWILWLFKLADAKTALVTFLVSTFAAILIGTRWVSKRHLGTWIVAGIAIALIAEVTLGVYAKTIELLGRDATLTDRTYVWEDVLQVRINPVVGTGFESFWLGERLEQLWAKHWWKPNQAHNGYIETYLNLGWVGVAILGALILSTFRKAQMCLLTDPDFGRFRLGLLFGILLFNYTDAIFKAMHPLWFVFFLIALDYNNGRRSRLTAAKLEVQKVNLVEAVAPLNGKVSY